MASVTISIPNIGNVVAENAATEETLLKLLKAMEKIGGAAGGEGKKAQDDLLKAKKDETDASKKQIKSTTELTGEQKKAREETEKFKSQLKDTGNNFVNFVGNIGKAAISLTAQFATAYQSIANNPIGAAAGIINTGIDLVNQGTKVATGFIGMIPFVGQGMKQAADAAADLAAALAKTANDIMAAEFKKSVAQLQQYTKAGASFAGGMIEMRNIAHDAGVSMEIMSKAAAAASADIRTIGLSQGEGAKAVGSAMKALASTTSSTGRSLRDEMLAMGYSYEEQGALAAQVMANQRAAGITRKMSDEELAQTTRTYAKDLKVLADITGKDAKKAMEEAQKKSMEADILAKLTPEEATKFQAAYAAMPDYAKKGFLEYVSSGGTAITDQATNIAMSQNREVEKLIKGGYAGIKDASKDASTVQKETLKQTVAAGEEGRKQAREGNAAINQAARLGATGLQGLADMNNQIASSGMVSADQIEKSGEAADKQAAATDGVTQGYIDVTAAGNKLAMTMEKLASENLPAYANLLGETMKKAIEAFEWLANKVRGGEAPLTPQQKETKQWQGEAPGTRTESGMDFSAGSFALGGIATGPLSGYHALLHGTEAILPMGGSSSMPGKLSDLPADIAKGAGDGKSMEDIASLFGKMTSSIASATSATSGSIDTGGIIELLRSQLDKQDEMLRAMEENKNATERLMYNLT